TSPVHPNTLAVRQAYSRALRMNGRLHEAREVAETTLEQVRVHVGPQSPHAQVSHLGLGITLMELGELDAARGHLEASLALVRIHRPMPDERLIPSLRNLGDLELAAGRLDRAEALYREGEEVLAAGGSRHPMDRADMLSGRGGVALARGEHARALELLEQALAIREAEVEHHPRDRAVLLERLEDARRGVRR
ncbi:MAG: tetratricopeptide repeat protein, partial [Myxococcales bacterium]|nr:tetratricopeptide repeat protein [Myxococcales bacterium]